jgi:GNAT superfamily N-acetyltransferase
MRDLDSASLIMPMFTDAPGPPPTLFDTGRYRAVELGAADIPELQRFFQHNPEYFIAVQGQPAITTEAHDEVHGTLPEGWPHTRRWILGFVDDTHALVGVANVVSDLLVPGVWHIGLFIVATRLHGSGAAHALYARLEGWARDSGAQWLRLGVVEGNTRAERFWVGRGFVEVRKRLGVEMGTRVNTVCVMAKALGEGTLAEYLTLVPRDRPQP